ncbi:hypothetical protein [Schinkia azotoformans]|uniref:hypothetical protein n=1 Tax=Schinkia azotoformans TaxID=1454 RepID=UPI0005514DA6|nr:hypothetical protein [Schinkia azotoformans]MEC1742959.1 hypothetical protein [Schinkia azotoformans]MED4374937.1 hypothetical protein [Schinkia azotoformans]MED4419039.1 hypothetical protein [Schinkia azotoformans]
MSMITLALNFGISKGFSLTSSILILTSFNLTNGISRIITGYGFVAGIIGPSLSGYLIDSTKGNFFPVFVYLGLLSVISSSLIYFVRPITKKMLLHSNMDLNTNM